MNWVQLGLDLFDAISIVVARHAPNVKVSTVAKITAAGVSAAVAALHQTGAVPSPAAPGSANDPPAPSSATPSTEERRTHG